MNSLAQYSKSNPMYSPQDVDEGYHPRPSVCWRLSDGAAEQDFLCEYNGVALGRIRLIEGDGDMGPWYWEIFHHIDGRENGKVIAGHERTRAAALDRVDLHWRAVLDL